LGVVLESGPWEQADAAADAVASAFRSRIIIDPVVPSALIYQYRSSEQRKFSHGAVSDPREIPIITECLTNSNFKVRIQAVRVLSSLAWFRPEAVASLRTALTNSDSRVREAVTNAAWMAPYWRGIEGGAHDWRVRQ
jgi:HEAT repeat protein